MEISTTYPAPKPRQDDLLQGIRETQQTSREDSRSRTEEVDVAEKAQPVVTRAPETVERKADTGRTHSVDISV